MACLVAEFESLAPARGAEVVVTADGSKLVINSLELAGLPAEVRPVRPLDGATGSGLFRTFAAVPHSEQAVAAFTKEFGPLGVQGDARQLGDGREVYGEHLDRWLEAQAAVARCIALWDALRNADRAAVSATLNAHVSRARVSGDRHLLESLESFWLTGDVLANGWRLLADLVENKTFFGSPRVALWPGSDRPLTLQLVADTLIQALWLQFELAVDGNRDYRSCATCGQFYELDPSVARTNRMYCSDACRSRAYRARRAGQED
jgi:hypothetical protein